MAASSRSETTPAGDDAAPAAQDLATDDAQPVDNLDLASSEPVAVEPGPAAKKPPAKKPAAKKPAAKKPTKKSKDATKTKAKVRSGRRKDGTPLSWDPESRLILERYVRDIADRIGLRDWNLDVDWRTSADPDALANVDHTDGQRRARIRIGKTFLKQTPRDQTATIVHELVHLHLGPLTWHIWNQNEALLPRIARKSANASFLSHLELATDDLANVIAQFLPPIPWT